MVVNPRGGCQGVGGVVESPLSIYTLGVDKMPRVGKTPRVATNGEGVTGEDGRGREGAKPPPTT